MQRIEKKILPEYYQEVIKEKKKFELRKDDDNIQPGDIIVLNEWEGYYTGNTVSMIVTYVLRNVPQYGLEEGYCIIGWR